MAIVELATFTDSGNYEYSNTLDAASYLLRFTYNGRDQHWYLSILSTESTELRSGIKLTTGNALLFLWRVQGRPPGNLTMVDPAGLDREAAFDDIGAIVFLTYVEQSTLIELLG